MIKCLLGPPSKSLPIRKQSFIKSKSLTSKESRENLKLSNDKINKLKIPSLKTSKLSKFSKGSQKSLLKKAQELSEKNLLKKGQELSEKNLFKKGQESNKILSSIFVKAPLKKISSTETIKVEMRCPDRSLLKEVQD